MKKIIVGISAVAALAVVILGADSFACDKKNKMAGNASCVTQGQCTASAKAGAACNVNADNKAGSACSVTAENKAGAGCCSKSGAAMTSSAGAGCSSKMTMNGQAVDGASCSSHNKSASADWAGNLCGSKGFYAANVYSNCHGSEMAVVGGKSFAVTESTPYIQVDKARYYFPDEASKSAFASKMGNTNWQTVDQETVALATAEANVVKTDDSGQKFAQCPVTGRTFVVTADSPARVIDGKKYYVGSGSSLEPVSDRLH